LILREIILHVDFDQNQIIFVIIYR